MSNAHGYGRILCVDDEPNVLKGLQRTLFEHFDVVTAASGAAGLDILRCKGPFAVVVSDLQMPEMDGTTFLAQVRDLVPDTVRVLLTGQAALDAAMAAVNEGHIFRFLTKPAPQSVLIRSLRAAAEQHRLLTERKRVAAALRESEARYRILVESSSQGLCIYRDATVLFVNAALARIFGYERPGELVGQDVRRLIPRYDRLHVEDAGSPGRGGHPAPVHGEWQGTRKDGTPIWLACTVSPLAWGGEPARLMTMIDITQRKEVERLKDELIATVSHELRTPLASLQGFAEIMLHRDYSPEQRHQFLTIIHKESLRLTHLIDDLLDVQRLQSGGYAYTFTHVYLGPLVEETVAVFRHAGSSHTFSVEGLDTLPPLRADADRLRQVLTNLLANAVKFSPHGGNVRVGAHREGDAVVVWVADQGIGIPPEAAPNLFTKFYRVDNAATRRIGGSGLGLALVKEIVEAHGGRVWVESEPGKGSTFFLTLPVSDPPWPVRDPLPSEDHPSS